MSIPRIAVITGAASGIGRCIALRLADDGCDIVASDLERQASLLSTLVEEISAKGRKAVSHIGDVTVEDSVKGLVDLAISTFGGIDIARFSCILIFIYFLLICIQMVANAGIVFHKPILERAFELL
jgi:NAD(P)-dependent dehydrogenase (short-subunit alcohol dehydrogenase family)